MTPGLRKTISVVAYPALVAWPICIAYCGLRLGYIANLGLPGIVSDAVLFIACVAPVLLGVLLLERAMPFRSEPTASTEDMRTDAMHLGLTWILIAPLSQQLVKAVAYVLAGRILSHDGTGIWPSHWPLLLQLMLAILIADFGHYWFHFMAHRTSLWRIHATHHATTYLYWFNATRFHIFEVLLQNLFQVGPLVVLGCNHEAFLMYGIFSTGFGWLQHSNVAYRTGILNWLVVTPELHHWHHSTIPEEGNHNYAGVLVLWDLLFSTMLQPRGRRFDGTMGISEMPDFPRTYLAQQLSPFTWNRLPRIATDEAQQPQISSAASG